MTPLTHTDSEHDSVTLHENTPAQNAALAASNGASTEQPSSFEAPARSASKDEEKHHQPDLGEVIGADAKVGERNDLQDDTTKLHKQVSLAGEWCNFPSSGPLNSSYFHAC